MKISELYEKHLAAVTQNGWALADVPEELKDYPMCLEAVKQNGWALEYVPEELKDYPMCLEAVKQNGWALEYVPEELKDYPMCLEAVKQNGWALTYVPKELRDYTMCLAAVKQNGWALADVPEGLKDREMYKAVLFSVFGENKEVTIHDDHVILYKVVNRDLSSLRDSTFFYPETGLVEVQNPDYSDASCSRGLHFSHIGYSHYYNNLMHRVIIKAEISYSDILAIDDGKVRCKKATILGRCDLEGKLI